MSNISQWSTTAASNSATPPDGWPETTMTIPQINDSARENMAAIARWYGDTKGSLVTAGAGNAYTLTTNSNNQALTDQSAFVFRADRSNTGAATLNVDGLGAKDMVIKGGQALESGNIVADQMVMAVYNSDQDRYELSFIGSGTTAADLASSALGLSLINGTLSASVESNALTIEVKTLAGNDPSAGDPVFALFRNATLSDGSFVVRRIEAPLSLVVPQGATLGTHVTGTSPFRLWLTLHDDAGTVRLGVSNRRTSTGIVSLYDAAKSTTTAMSGAADSAGTFYTSTAITTAAPIHVVGYVEYTTGLATPGDYNNAPDIVHLKSRNTPLPGQTTGNFQQVVKTDTELFATFINTIPGFAVTIPMSSSANAVRVKAQICHGTGVSGRSDAVGFRITHDGAAVVEGDAATGRNRVTMGSGGDPETTTGGGSLQVAAFDNLYFPEASGDQDFGADAVSNTVNVGINRSIRDDANANSHRATSTLSVEEIMA